MKPAAEKFGAELALAQLREPTMQFWSPVDARQHSSVEEIRALLMRQLASPVRWADLIRALTAAGAVSFVECGPGSVLTGLNKRIDRSPEVECHALGGPAGDRRGNPR
jgi:[acyl-carrier-protein] S-malonyltransferase